MDPQPAAPILSRYEDDPALRPQLDEFVFSLGERIDALQDAELSGDLKQLADQCAILADRADRLGYAPLAECCRDVHAAALAQETLAARTRLLDLTDVARRIRLGHRGAAT
jgi:hypothetical protein